MFPVLNQNLRSRSLLFLLFFFFFLFPFPSSVRINIYVQHDNLQRWTDTDATYSLRTFAQLPAKLFPLPFPLTSLWWIPSPLHCPGASIRVSGLLVGRLETQSGTRHKTPRDTQRWRPTNTDTVCLWLAVYRRPNFWSSSVGGRFHTPTTAMHRHKRCKYGLVG